MTKPSSWYGLVQISWDNITNGAREKVESLWVVLQREENNGKVILGVCYRPSNLRGRRTSYHSLE